MYPIPGGLQCNCRSLPAFTQTRDICVDHALVYSGCRAVRPHLTVYLYARHERIDIAHQNKQYCEFCFRQHQWTSSIFAVRESGSMVRFLKLIVRIWRAAGARRRRNTRFHPCEKFPERKRFLDIVVGSPSRASTTMRSLR